MALSQDQSNALASFKDFLVHPTQQTMVIHGSPGRGKTFLTNEICKAALEISQMQKLLNIKRYELEIHSTATTNKAAEVFAKAIGHDAKTIHSLIGVRPVFNFKTGKNRLLMQGNYGGFDDSLILIDEASGICKTLKHHIKATTKGSKVLMIGDKNQLTAVGSNYCCAFEGADVTAELTTGQRFGTNSAIAQLGAQLEETIQTGKFNPIVADGDTIRYIDGDELESLARQHFTMKLVNTNHAKIVCWGNPTVRFYNDCIRGMHTTSVAPEVGEILVSNKPVMEGKNTLLYTEQRVMVTDVQPTTTMKFGVEGWNMIVNGDTEIFQPCHQYLAKDMMDRLYATKEYIDFNIIKDTFADLRPLHASTAYKAQGSTYNVVFIDLNDIGKCHDWMTVARMLNVATSRAKTNVYLYGKLPKKYQDMQHVMPKPDEEYDYGADAPRDTIPF